MVVVGGGFGGLQAVHGLRHADVEITLVDRRNFHLFQPLTYQVATGALTPGEVAAPLRAIFKRQKNVNVLMSEVTGFDLERRIVHAEPELPAGHALELPYDTLIVAGGSSYSYFGHDEWKPYAPEVKSLESALGVRGRILSAFEAAELEPDADTRRAWLTFVVVGAGPTGVEMAGQIGEMAHDTLARSFRAIDVTEARVLLIETADRVLTSFPASLSAKAERSLRELGVTPLLGHSVVDIDADGVTVDNPDQSRDRIPARTVVWAAGVTASALATRLAEATGAELDRAGRLAVEPDLSLPGHPEVLALGDMVRVRDATGQPVVYPGVAPVAMQQGRHAAGILRDRVARPSVNAVPLPQQGQPGHDRPGARRGRSSRADPAERAAGLVHLAVRAPLVPGGLPEPGPRVHPLELQLLYPRARLPADHRRGGDDRDRRGGAGAGERAGALSLERQCPGRSCTSLSRTTNTCASWRRPTPMNCTPLLRPIATI